jgi:hypothetical protein
MAFLDDVRASLGRLEVAQARAATELADATGQLTAVLFNRLRPVPALSWADDPVLTEACRAFAASAIQGATAAVLPPTP